jgi:hypothetical protein
MGQANWLIVGGKEGKTKQNKELGRWPIQLIEITNFRV